MTDPYDHLRTPSAYDDMIRPLLEALEATKRNMEVTHGNEWSDLLDCKDAILHAIDMLENAHEWDGDEPRT